MIWFAPYVVVSVVHLVVLAAGVDGAASLATKAALMPLLALAVVRTALWTTARDVDPAIRLDTQVSVPQGGGPTPGGWTLRRRSAGFGRRPDGTVGERPAWLPLVLVALAFSWFGDLALDGSRGARFLIGIGFFLVAQLAYIATFRRVGDATRTSTRPWLIAPYVAWWVGFLAFFVASTGPDPLLAAVAAYGVALGAMAYLAHRVNAVTAVGAALFLISDSLIGLSGFADLELPLYDVWVMSTYVLGQGLIAAGLLRHRSALR